MRQAHFAGLDAYTAVLRSFVLCLKIEIVEAGDGTVDPPLAKNARGTPPPPHSRSASDRCIRAPATGRGVWAGHGRFPCLAGNRPRSLVISRTRRVK